MKTKWRALPSRVIPFYERYYIGMVALTLADPGGSPPTLSSYIPSPFYLRHLYVGPPPLKILDLPLTYQSVFSLSIPSFKETIRGGAGGWITMIIFFLQLQNLDFVLKPGSLLKRATLGKQYHRRHLVCYHIGIYWWRLCNIIVHNSALSTLTLLYRYSQQLFIGKV